MSNGRHTQKWVMVTGTLKATCILDVCSSEGGIRRVKMKELRVYFVCREDPMHLYGKGTDLPLLLLAHRWRSTEIIAAIKPKRRDR